MELYSKVSYAISRELTLAYSSSFGTSSLLFPKQMRRHIHAVYGMVRIADEIVDTYKGPDAAELLDAFEHEVYAAIRRGYSVNPIVHAFSKTAKLYDIDKKLIAPFFKSMRIDLRPQTYDVSLYQEYIHGSAEVVGLMCLRVFVQGDSAKYKDLQDGAAALGSAYQKVNFLRDLSADYKELGRVYFPGVRFESFDDKAKQLIVKDIRNDLARSLVALKKLPRSSRQATMTSYVYYSKLLDKIERTPATVIKHQRIRIPGSRKALLFAGIVLREGLKR